MRLFSRRRDRVAAGEVSPAQAGAGDEALPIAGYEQLDPKQVIARLPSLSQIDLARVEADERAHRARPVVLNKLRWLQVREPLPGYDALEVTEIVRALGRADARTVKAVRSYERHHRDRHEVRAEIARLMPTAQPAPGEDRAREEKAALVRAGIRPDHSPVDRPDPARDARNELARLGDEARYRRERLELYQARVYGGRATSETKMRELQRASDGAAARLHAAETAAR